MRQLLLTLLGRTIYAVYRWSLEPLPAYWAKKQVLAAFPHGSWGDTAIAFAGFALTKQKGHIIVKKEAFRWPMAPIMRAFGAIPVDRKHSTGIVEQMVAEFDKRDTFQLALVPEGTRRSGAKVRTGFWHIAKAAKVPITCSYLDHKRRRTCWVGQIMPGDDVQADLRQIKRMYAGVGHVIEGIDD